MCLIIANPSAARIPSEYILNAFVTNHDGFGVMYAKDGELRVKRGLFTITHIIEIFQELVAAKLPYVAHFRFATHGATDGRNCHPFPVSTKLGGVAMVHNGTLTGNHWRSEHKSDTSLFVNRLQKHLDAKHFAASDLFSSEVPVIGERFADDLGSDKLVFMNGKGNINFYNENNGIWIGDVWYSNTYSLARDIVKVSTWNRGGWKTKQANENSFKIAAE